MVRKFKCARSS